MIRRLFVVTLIALAACATADADREADLASDSSSNARGPKTRYTMEPGPTPVGVIPDVLLHDPQRNKDIALTIEYPTRGGPSPLIVWSHGFGGSNRSYVGLSAHWASYGYVVIKPSHADSTIAQRMRDVDDIWESQTAADWRNRVRDITFVLDSLDALEQRYPELQGKIDRAHIGVGGHSYGAFTAMLLGGVRTFPGAASYADPRVKAVVAMSPQGPSAVRGLTTESWAELRVPALFMTGTLDKGINDSETPEWRQQAFELSPAGDKWLVVIEGARHASFGSRSEQLLEQQARETRTEMDPYFNPGNPGTQRGRGAASSMAIQERTIFGLVKGLSVAFWDTYLRGDAAGREHLEKANETKLVQEKKK